MKFLADEHISRALIEGLILHLLNADVLHVSDVGLAHTPDPDILQWAAESGRVVLTKDQKTMKPLAYGRVREGMPMPGVIIIREGYSIGVAVRGIIDFASGRLGELENQVVYVTHSSTE